MNWISKQYFIVSCTSCTLYLTITGVCFNEVMCDGCKQNPLLGARWKCKDCNDYDLCSYCYNNNIHDLKHNFIRYDHCNLPRYPKIVHVYHYVLSIKFISSSHACPSLASFLPSFLLFFLPPTNPFFIICFLFDQYYQVYNEMSPISNCESFLCIIIVNLLASGSLSIRLKPKVYSQILT